MNISCVVDIDPVSILQAQLPHASYNNLINITIYVAKFYETLTYFFFWFFSFCLHT